MALLPFASSFKLKIGSKVSSGTSGSVLFIDSNGLLAQNNAQFFWDNTNNALRVGTGSAANPTYTATTLFNSGMFFPTVAANAFSVVQSRKTSVNGAVADGAVTLAFSSQLTAGNFIFVAIAIFSQNSVATELSDASRPTDTLLHTYTGVDTEVVFNSGSVNTQHGRCFYVANCNAGANTVTVHLDNTLGAGGELTLVIAELQGISTSSPLDVKSSSFNNTAGTAADSGSATTTNANDVILGMVMDGTGANPATFTRGDSASDILDETNGAANQVMATSYNVKSATGSYKASWTIDSSRWGAQMGAFKLASGTTYILVGLSTNGSERMRIDQNGLIGIGVTSPASRLHLKAGSATQNTAPLQFNSGTLETTPRAGVVEFLTDAWYGTITTGPTRGIFALHQKGRSTGQTGAVASVLAYTLPATDASFIVSMNILITAFTAGTVSGVITYTDEGGTARSLTMNFSSITGALGTTIGAAGAFEGVPLHIRVKASTTITITTTVSIFTGTYNVDGSITQIA